MANTFRPTERVSMRNIPADNEDRKKMKETFNERKANQERIKAERFAKIEERRKANRDGKGRGINIEVTSDS